MTLRKLAHGMWNKLFLVSLLILASSAMAISQSHEPFTGTAQPDLSSPQVQKWIKPGGIYSAASAIGRDGSGNGYPSYTNDTAGYYGYLMYDTSTGTSAEVNLVLKQKSGNNNTKEIILFRDGDASFATGGGMCMMFVPQSNGTSQIAMRFYSINYGMGTPYVGHPHMTGAGTDSKLFTTAAVAIGDTLFLRYWTDGTWTSGIRHVGGGVDSSSILTSVYTGSSLTIINAALSSTGRFGLAAMIRGTRNLVDDFRISLPGAATPPPPPPAVIDTLPPVFASFSSSKASHVATTTPKPYLLATVTDLFGVKKVVFDSSANNSTWVPFDSVIVNTGTPVTSTNVTSISFDRTGKDTVWFRARVFDDTAFAAAPVGTHTATSGTSTVIFQATGVATANKSRIFADAILGAINTSSYTDGMISYTSLNWAPYDVVSMFNFYPSGLTTFATDGNTPAGSKVIVDYIHGQGTAVTACIGVSNTRFQSWIFPNITQWISNATKLFIDTLGYDGFEIDCEPYSSADTLNLRIFLSALRDTLNTRSSAYSWTGKPLITVDLSTGTYWGMARVCGPGSTSCAWHYGKRIQQYVDYVNLMTYDKMGNWDAFLAHESAIRSFPSVSSPYQDTWWEACAYGSPYNGCPSYYPSLEFAIKAAIDAGFDISKLGVGLDFHAAGFRGGTFANSAEGALHPRDRVISAANSPTQFLTGPNYGLSEWKFWAFYRDRLATNPDSVHWDDSSKSYYMSFNYPGTTNDEYISFAGGPGLDSMVKATLNLADDYKLGSILLWSLGETTIRTVDFPTATYPNLDRDWIGTAFAKYAVKESLVTVLDPPSTFSPATGATGVATSFTFDWNDVTTPAAGVPVVKYWLQISTVSNFLTTAVSDSTLVTSQRAVSGLSNNTLYYARASTKNANGWGNWSPPITFTTIPAAPGTPTLNTPGNLSTGNPQSLSLIWLAPTTGGTTTHYQILVDQTADNFASPFVDDSTVTSLSKAVSGLANSTSYIWKVRAKSFPGTWSSYTSAWTFTTGAAIPTAPSLVVPINGAMNRNANTQLTWSTVSGANSYRVQIDDDLFFGSPLKDTTTTSTVYFSFGLVSGTTYYWHVYSIGTAGNSQYSAPYQFTVGTDVQPPAPGQLGNFPLTYNRVSQKWVSDAVSGTEAQLAWIFDYLKPVNSNNITWGPRGWKDTNGDTVSYLTSASGSGGSMSAQSILDSLRTLDLSGLRFSQPMFKNGFRVTGDDSTLGMITFGSPNQGTFFNLAMPRGTGALATTEEVSGSFQILSVTSTATINNLRATTLYGTTFERDGGTGVLTLGTSVTELLSATNHYADLGGPSNYFKLAYIDSIYLKGTKFDFRDNVPDSLNATIHLRDSAMVNFWSPTNTFKGRIGYWSNTDALALISPASTNGSVFVGSGNDGSGLWVSDQVGSANLQYTATERVHRNRTAFTNTDGIEDTWVRRDTTVGVSGKVAFYVRLDSATATTEDYAGYSSRPSTFIIYLDVIATRTDVAGYAAYSRRLVVDNNAGTVTIRQTDTIGTDVESNANLGISIAMGGTNSDGLSVTVSGDTGQNWTWHTHAKILITGN